MYLREACGVSKEDLVKLAGDLFKRSAWTSTKHVFILVHTWDELDGKMREVVLPYFHQENFEREINSVTQGSQEKGGLFTSAMECPFNRLTQRREEAWWIDI